MSGLTKAELLPILRTALSVKNLQDISVELLGNSEKGDGYLGDIIFALITGSVKGVARKFHVVLKCGKKSQVLRKNSPVRESFLNEIYVYSRVFPALRTFALEKKPDLVFDCVPKCLGTYSDENMEVIVLENLRQSGYNLWDRRKPATLEHLKIVLHQYGKWHALSAALRDQQPQKYEEIANGFIPLWPQFNKQMNFLKLFGQCIEEGADLLKDEIDEDIRETWLNFKDQVEEIIMKQTTRTDCFTVMLHGDCWINNFMFKCEKDDPLKPIRPAFIDWQLSSDCTPICDLSYFLYASISKKDLDENFDSLLKLYHDSFTSYVKKLGSDPHRLYTHEEFLKDWKRFGRFGIMMATLIYKIALVDKDEAPDMAVCMESGKELEEAFQMELKDTYQHKLRLKPLVLHAVARGFI